MGSCRGNRPSTAAFSGVGRSWLNAATAILRLPGKTATNRAAAVRAPLRRVAGSVTLAATRISASPEPLVHMRAVPGS